MQEYPTKIHLCILVFYLFIYFLFFMSVKVNKYLLVFEYEIHLIYVLMNTK